MKTNYKTLYQSSRKILIEANRQLNLANNIIKMQIDKIYEIGNENLKLKDIIKNQEELNKEKVMTVKENK